MHGGAQSMQGGEGDEGWMAEGAADLDAQLSQREVEMGLGGAGAGQGAETDAADMASRIQVSSSGCQGSIALQKCVREHPESEVRTVRMTVQNA